jgi:hypothetical protein
VVKHTLISSKKLPELRRFPGARPRQLEQATRSRKLYHPGRGVPQPATGVVASDQPRETATKGNRSALCQQVRLRPVGVSPLARIRLVTVSLAT